jgi:hypothetical protein
VTQLRVVHVLRWFEQTSEWLVGEEPLREVTADELRALFELAADDPVYNVYPVGEREAAWLGARTAHVFDRDAYFYVIEAQQRGAEIAQQREAGIEE